MERYLNITIRSAVKQVSVSIERLNLAKDRETEFFLCTASNLADYIEIFGMIFLPGAEKLGLFLHSTGIYMEITIRPANKDDCDAIASLIAELAESINEESPVRAQYVAHYLRTPGSYILLAEKDWQVVGLLSYSIRPNLYHAGDTCLIEEFVVQVSERGQGIGGRLLETLFKELTNQNCVEVSVTTMPDNLKAIAFYKSHGMVDEAVFLEKHFHRK